jgi:hypothetical protein
MVGVLNVVKYHITGMLDRFETWYGNLNIDSSLSGAASLLACA